MARYFFDTSAFTKFYHPEIGSVRVTALMREPRAILQISNLVLLETRSALALKVRTGALDQTKAESAMDEVFRDIARGLIRAVRLNEAHVDEAQAIVTKYGYKRRMRTLDALQLAVALDLHRRNHLDVLVVADKLLGEVAALDGLLVENPEDTP